MNGGGTGDGPQWPERTGGPAPAGGPTIAVRGEVTREVDPEIAEFQVTVRARDRDRRRTLDLLAARTADLRGMLDGYAGAVEKRETAGMYVHPERRGSDERIRGYAGTVTTSVTVGDFTVLGELLTRVADREDTTVSGPWWRLRPGSPVHAEARRAAIDAALERARDYAAALGSRITGLVELADEGAGAQPFAARDLRHAAGGAVRGAAPELELEPQRQTVVAAVEVRLRVTEPTGLDSAAGAHPDRAAG